MLYFSECVEAGGERCRRTVPGTFPSFESFENIVPLPSPPPACPESAKVIKWHEGTGDEAAHWLMARFFWMRSTPTGWLLAVNGNREGNDGIAPGVWGRNLNNTLGLQFAQWKRLSHALPASNRQLRRLCGVGSRLTSAPLRKMLLDFAERAAMAGLLDAAIPYSDQWDKLAALVRDERRGPKILVAFGWREHEAVGGTLGSSFPSQTFRFDLWHLASGQSEPPNPLLRHCQTLTAVSGSNPTGLGSVTFACGNASGGAVASTSQANSANWAGELNPDDPEGLRWFVLPLPVLAFWLDVAESGGFSPLDEADISDEVFVSVNFNFAARTGKASAACRMWMPPVELETQVLPPPWEWGAETPGETLPFEVEPQAECSSPLMQSVIAGTDPAFALSGIGTSLLKLSIDYDALPCGGPDAVLAANMNVFESWHFRRGAGMFAESFAVWHGNPAVPNPSGSPRILWGNGAESFVSLDGGTSFHPLGTRSTQPLDAKTAYALADTVGWKTQGLGMMRAFDVAHVPSASPGDPDWVLICTDDGGPFRAQNKSNSDELVWTSPNWNVPQGRTQFLPGGLGPPTFRQTQRSSEGRVAWRRVKGGKIETFLAVGALHVPTESGRVLLSRDQGYTWNDRELRELPEGVIAALASSADPSVAEPDAAEHTLLASVSLQGVFMLGPSSYKWERLGDFFAHTPSSDMLAFRPDQEPGPPGHVSLRKRLAYECMYLQLVELDHTAPLFDSDPLFDEAVRQALEKAVESKELDPTLDDNPFNGSEVIRKRDIVRNVYSAVDLLEPTLRNTLHLTFVRHPSGSLHAYASLNLRGILPILNGQGRGPSAPGSWGTTLPTGLEALALPMVDPTLLPPNVEAVTVAAQIARRLFRAAGAVSADYAGLYRLERQDTLQPADMHQQQAVGLYWRQLTGLARANAITLPDVVDENQLTTSQLVSTGFPQAWRSITALAASPDGRLAVTTDTIKLGTDSFEPLTGPIAASPPSRNVIFEGGAFLLEDPKAPVPANDDSPSSSLPVRLLFTHPAAVSAAFSQQPNPQLFVALNVYDAMEGLQSGTGAEAMVPVVGPFTSPFPAIKRLDGNQTFYPLGITLANEQYFSVAQNNSVPQMLWPTGIFRVQLTSDGLAIAYSFSAESEKSTNENTARAAKVPFAQSLMAPDTVGSPCLDNPPKSGELQFASCALVDVTKNQCCAPHDYIYLKVLGDWLYCGRYGAGTKRTRLSALELTSPVVSPPNIAGQLSPGAVVQPGWSP